jgi:hypothetical protein
VQYVDEPSEAMGGQVWTAELRMVRTKKENVAGREVASGTDLRCFASQEFVRHSAHVVQGDPHLSEPDQIRLCHRGTMDGTNVRATRLD